MRHVTLLDLVPAVLVGLLLGLPASAQQFDRLATTVADALLDATPLGDDTIAITGDQLLLVDWARPVGERSSRLLLERFGADGLHAFEDTVYAQAYFSRRYKIWRGDDGHPVVVEQPQEWRQPNVRLAGERYQVARAANGFAIYPAPGDAPPVSSVQFDITVGFHQFTWADDRAVASRWADGNLTLQVADLSDPLASVLGPVVSLTTIEPYDLLIHDHTLVLVRTMLQSVDIDDIEAPNVLDIIGVGGRLWFPAVRPDGLIAGWAGRDLRTFDCSDPGHLLAVSSRAGILAPNTYPTTALFLDDQRIVTAIDHGAHQFPLSPYPGPILDGGVAWWRITGRLLASDGQWVWVQGDRRSTIDPTGINRWQGCVVRSEDNGGATGTRDNVLIHRAGHLYYASGDGTLQIEDVRDPRSPSVVARFSPPDDVETTAVSDGLLALAHGDSVSFYDVQTPSSPVRLGALVLEGPAVRIDLAAPAPFLIERRNLEHDRAVILDLADPSAPVVASTVVVSDADPLQGIASVVGHVCHDTEVILQVWRNAWYFTERTVQVDLADPYEPLVTVAETTSDFWGYEGYGPFDQGFSGADAVFAGFKVSARNESLRLFRYDGDPTAIEFLDILETRATANALLPVGMKLFALDDGGVTMVTLTDLNPVDAAVTAPASGLHIAPNPFNPRTTLHFTMERAGRTTARIHDLRGRRVRTLRAELPAGPASLLWDGDDDQGRALPSGAYLVRVSMPTGTRTARCSLVR